MALTREDIYTLLHLLDEDPQLLEELRRRILPDHFIVAVRLPTEWMAQVDRRLSNLERDIGGLKQDVKSMKQDVGRLKGMSEKISFARKQDHILGRFSKVVGMLQSWLTKFWIRQKRTV